MSTVETIFLKAQKLPPAAQVVVLEFVESLGKQPLTTSGPPKPQFGSAKGLVTVPSDFDQPLDDFKPYRE